jgi:hypothetical protein
MDVPNFSPDRERLNSAMVEHPRNLSVDSALAPYLDWIDG